MPRVSVVLTSPHPGAYLRETIDAVLDQTFSDLDLTICGDDREDVSRSVASARPDPRIKAWVGDGARRGALGVGSALSETAVAEYVATLRSGDLWALDKLEREVAYLDGHPDLGAVFTRAQPNNGHRLESARPCCEPSDSWRWAWLRQLFRGQWAHGDLGILVRTQSLRDAGPYRSGLARTGDIELLSRLLIQCPVQVLEGGLVTGSVPSGAGGGRGGELEAEIQEGNEWNVLRENYLSISSLDDVMSLFPDLDRFGAAGGFDIQFLLAMACLYQCNQRSAWDLGLRWLFELVDDKDRCPQIQALYGFSYPDLIRLTAEFDVYGMEWARLIADWEQQGGSAWDKLIADRDWLVDQRQWLLSERERLVAERERLMVERQAFMDEIHRSMSWRLTRPVRSVSRLLPRRHASPAAGETVPGMSADKDSVGPRAALSTGLGGPSLDGTCDVPAKAPSGRGIDSPVRTDALSPASANDILLVVHEFSRTGAPYAGLYLARALSALRVVRPVVLSPMDGPLRQEYEGEGFVTVVDASWIGDTDLSPGFGEWVGGFERVIVISLGAFQFVERFRGKAKRLTWWIHETAVGFDTLATLTADLPVLFSACESIWLGSPLCFPLAGRYASPDKLHLLLYGCEDRVLSHRPHPSGKVVFLVVGSVEQRKGQDVFLDAIGRLSDESRRGAIFWIVGSPLPGNRESEAFSLRVRSRAALLPEVRCFSSMPLERLRQFYSEADVMVSASRDDPMPIVMTEGLMQSKVCLCSSAIGHARLLEDGTDGLIFASESAQQLADKMAWIIANRDELAALGAAGRAVYERHFLISDFVKNVGTLLESCA
jgi:glycosyltransferase involved in cell wall biosynthesis